MIKDIGREFGNAHRWLIPLRAAQLLGRRTMMYAVGVEWVHPRSAPLIRRVVERCDLVTLRDPDSFHRLRALGIQTPAVVTSDPAMMLEVPTRSDRPRGSPLVAVSLRNWLTSGYHVANPEAVGRFELELAAALDALIETRGVELRFAPFRIRGADDDRLAFDRVKKLMRHPTRSHTLPHLTPGAMAQSLSDCDFVLAMRLHSAILAAAAGTPFLAVDYAPKVSAFAQHIGLGDATIGLGEAEKAFSLRDRILSAYDAREPSRRVLAATVPIHRELARLNGRMLVALSRDENGGVSRCVREAESWTETLALAVREKPNE